MSTNDYYNNQARTRTITITLLKASTINYPKERAREVLVLGWVQLLEA
jgi:hypothetical protein